jgi:hypothetical protein
MKRCEASLPRALNDAAGAGVGSGQIRHGRFVQKTDSMGAEQRFHWDKALAAADAIADEEIARIPGLPAAGEGD